MATLPDQIIDLSAGVDFASQPSLTWGIDKDTQRIRGEVNELTAVSQAVDIILNTERFQYQIFSPSSGITYDGLIGADRGFVVAELRRRIADAISVDDRINGVTEFNTSFSEDVLTVEVKISTVFGDLVRTVEVTLI